MSTGATAAWYCSAHAGVPLARQVVQPPPPNIDTNLEPPENGEPKTVREMLEEHRENPKCAGCHSFIDPPGFLFEHFDSIGAYRDKLPGNLPVDIPWVALVESASS